VLVHSYAPTEFAALSVLLRVLPGCPRYEGSERFGIDSRTLISSKCKGSLKVARVEYVERGGIISRPSKGQGLRDRVVPHMRQPATKGAAKASSAKSEEKPKRARFTEGGLAVTFDAQHDLCFKYSVGLVSDVGLDESMWTSARLRTHNIVLQTPKHQSFVLSLDTECALYRWSELPAMTSELIMPCFRRAFNAGSKRKLAEFVTSPTPKVGARVVYADLGWEELEWGASHVRVRDTLVPLATLQFVPV
jgi:hypothetical protein